MVAALVIGIAASPWVRAARRYGIIVLALLLFLPSHRRFGEQAGRLVERLETIAAFLSEMTVASIPVFLF